MRKLPLLIVVFVVAFASCIGDENSSWQEYAEWREANINWLKQQVERKNADGTPYYKQLRPESDSTSYVYVHYFNDRELTKNNLQPLYTSTVDVIYKGQLYDTTPFDSSYMNTADYGDSLFRTKVGSVIPGWQYVLQDMHVGDTCEVLIPYQQGYGISGSGIIQPYSVFVFGMKLTNIPAYEKP